MKVDLIGENVSLPTMNSRMRNIYCLKSSKVGLIQAADAKIYNKIATEIRDNSIKRVEINENAVKISVNDERNDINKLKKLLVVDCFILSANNCI